MWFHTSTPPIFGVAGLKKRGGGGEAILRYLIAGRRSQWTRGRAQDYYLERTRPGQLFFTGCRKLASLKPTP